MVNGESAMANPDGKAKRGIRLHLKQDRIEKGLISKMCVGL